MRQNGKSMILAKMIEIKDNITENRQNTNSRDLLLLC